jgi:pyruvate,water dikinase
MSTFVLSLSDPQATLKMVGDKGLSLTKLTHAGLPIPDGFHMITKAYCQFIAIYGLRTLIPTNCVKIFI